ncbi:alpha-ketoglutarate-dependent dioxygenase AlkB [Algicella marina]|uniref:Alpha-ketoglutarate-dependent dioxygenase AlkB n=1 Tax=Algicella marina TaxID=2683284 RepID=A0A6P1SVX8_9RHOB|nr:alpha-ketoglutarate-dependent dioxygenase AlkB [Algicella marina]QHQ33917.1 alpha-ketoglutarate-dependent dioxygenase AlkB [Algicella marina]
MDDSVFCSCYVLISCDIVKGMSLFLPGLDLPVPALPAGLVYTPEFINSTEERCLMAAVEREKWNREISRPRQSHGGRHGPLPDWLAAIARRLADSGHMEEVADKVVVNGYAPGQGIGAHVDDTASCGGEIAIVSLGSLVEMVFAEVAGERKAAQLLEPRSLLMLSGAARYDWSHAISARRSDPVAGMRMARQWRVSLTFRTSVRRGPATA